jgi:peptide/nickel transport system substrate-binding protein
MTTMPHLLTFRPRAAWLFSLLLALAAACGPAPTAPTPTSAPPTTAAAAQPSKPQPAATQPAAAAGTPKRGGVARVGLSQEPIILNTLLGSQTVNTLVTESILEGLLVGGADGTYVPVLAEEVPTQQNGGVSPDGKTITWKLKKGVTWSDGKPFTSRDVLFTYNVIMNSENPVVIRSGYPDIASVTAPDDTTVVVNYKTVYAAFKDHFGRVLPEHVFNGDTLIDKKEFNRAPIGTGPFKFKSWASGDNITLERNTNFRDREKPHLDGIVFKIVPSREAAVQAFKAGEIDVLWNLIEANIPEFEGMADAVIQPQPSPRVERLILNASCPGGPQQGDPKCPHPVLGDVRVRQAIELAINKKAIVDKLLFGKTTVATSVMPGGWFTPALPPSEFDPQRAKQLMDEAGWTPGSDGIRVNNGVRAHIEYGTTTGDRLREQTQQVIQEQLREIGIEIEIKNAPSAVLLGVWQDNAPRARGNFDMLMWTTNPDLDPQAHLHSYFHGSQVPTEQTRSGRNYHRIIDPELDKALETAGSTVDEDARKAAYKTVAERVNADKGHVILYNRLDIDAFKKYVKGHVNDTWDTLGWDTANWWLDR